jgi:hypothetical protein
MVDSRISASGVFRPFLIYAWFQVRRRVRPTAPASAVWDRSDHIDAAIATGFGRRFLAAHSPGHGVGDEQSRDGAL